MSVTESHRCYTKAWIIPGVVFNCTNVLGNAVRPITHHENVTTIIEDNLAPRSRWPAAKLETSLKKVSVSKVNVLKTGCVCVCVSNSLSPALIHVHTHIFKKCFDVFSSQMDRICTYEMKVCGQLTVQQKRFHSNDFIQTYWTYCLIQINTHSLIFLTTSIDLKVKIFGNV